MVENNPVNIEYPALYVASDLKSTQAQRYYLRGIYGLLLLLVSSALVSLFAGNNQIIAIIALVIIALTPIISLFLAWKRYDKLWYAGRSLAESIKTISWRYMMRSQPYQDDNNSRASFVSDLRKLFDDSKHFCQHLSETTANEEQMPAQMEKIRRLDFNNRKQVYRKNRIDEQRNWYAKKSAYNNRMSTRWFWAMLGFQVLAIVCAAIRIAQPNWVYLPTEVLAAAAAAVIGWVQAKRFQELGTSYTLAALEIGMVRMALEDVKNEEQFSEFVGDAENAFSREHTQWLARRDI